MTDDPNKKPLLTRPSASTVGSAVGGMAATLLILILDKTGLTVDAVSAASIGGGMAALAGYFLSGGKAADME